MRNATEMTPYDQEERLLIISQQFGKGKKGGLPTYEALAKLCKCSPGTIYGDMKVWKENGGLDAFVLDEFGDMYKRQKMENPLEVFKILSKFLMKGMGNKVTIDANVKVGIDYTQALKSIFIPAEDVKVIDSDNYTEHNEEPTEEPAG